MPPRAARFALTCVAAAAALAACGSTSARAQAPRPARRPHPAATTSTGPTTSPSTTSVPSPTSAPPASTYVASHPTTPAPPSTPATSPAPSSLLVTRLAGIGSAGQVIAVEASGYGTSVATVTAYQRGPSGWTQAFGPWTAYIGRNGVAPSGEKREGDGRTPSGVYGFDFMFGVDADPGVHFPYRHITGSNIVWDDDPASANYNEWIDTTQASAGADPEPMDDTPSYLYGAVIAYNDARTPGLGSAIFLHVSHGSSTAGCVSLPEDELLSLLRWLDPGRSPRIAIGTPASLTAS